MKDWKKIEIMDNLATKFFFIQDFNLLKINVVLFMSFLL